ncbi:Putative trans-acting enoyl reductase MT2525 [Durusdinium trenchii]|uniref:Trans-acting enoyl reductase MT2525 n=1 Tax=Durusdinium trenchii TaxID=1381693 RepID=A0ABP0L6W5_9DINO
MESLKRLTALLTAVAAHKFDLILYGADAWRNAGNRSHLEDVVSQLTDVKSKPDVLVAALDGHSDPKDWLKSTRAVITAAGPFSIHGGEELLRAAAELGVHYADTSDEFYWQRWMIDRYDQVVLSSGFCVLAGDLGAQLALRPLQNRSADASVASLDAWLEGYNGGVSAGVIHTAEAMKNASFPKAWETDPYVLAPNATADLRKDTKVEGMHYPSWVSGEGVVVPNIFGPYDARLLRRSFVQLEQAVTLRVGATAGMYPKWTAFIAEHPGSWSKLTKCPTETVYKDGKGRERGCTRFKFGVMDAVLRQQGSGVLLSGHGDPGYRFTAVGLAETGLCLAGKTSKCPKPLGCFGVLTPMAALEATVLPLSLVGWSGVQIWLMRACRVCNHENVRLTTMFWSTRFWQLHATAFPA